MNKYLILFMFSFSALTMEDSKGFLSEADFQRLFDEINHSTLTKSQCDQIKKLIEEKGGVAPKQCGKRSASKALETPSALKKPKIDLPKGVVIYKILEVKREDGEKTGVLYVSPSKKKNVVYCHFAIDNYWDHYIDTNKRIDIRKILKELDISARELKTKKHLHAVLLHVELKVRELFFQDECLLRSIVYAGLAEDFKHRSTGHGGDVVHHASHKKIASKKVQFEQGMLREGHSLRMSYLIENIPKAYLPVFECLMAKLTFAFDFGASAKIGDAASWEKINKYWGTSARIKEIKESDFGFSIEALRARVRAELLGTTSQSASADRDYFDNVGNIPGEGDKEKEDDDEENEVESEEDEIGPSRFGLQKGKEKSPDSFKDDIFDKITLKNNTLRARALELHKSIEALSGIKEENSVETQVKEEGTDSEEEEDALDFSSSEAESSASEEDADEEEEEDEAKVKKEEIQKQHPQAWKKLF